MYSPLIEPIWSGRTDAKPNEYVYQQINCLDLSKPASLQTDYQKKYVLLGFQSDEGVTRNLGRAGASQGPSAFRKAFGKLPIHKPFELFDAGNVACLDHDLENAQQVLGNKVAQCLSLGLNPIVIGGGHETAWGHYQGLNQHFQDQSIALLNFDAHFDLRPLINNQQGSSGTPFFQIHQHLKAQNKPFYYYCAGIQPFSNTMSLFQTAHEFDVNYCLAETIHATPNDLTFVQQVIKNHEKIYVSVCLDVFSATIAPGVSAPQPLGIGISYVIKALRYLKASNKVVSLDFVELSPPYDINDQTAKLASCLLMEYLAPFL